MGRFDNWDFIQYLVGDRWAFYPAPDGVGAVGLSSDGTLMSPQTAEEIFEALSQFFNSLGRERVQKACDEQIAYMESSQCGTKTPSILQFLFPEEFKDLSITRSYLRTPRTVDKQGFVYVLRASNGTYKIGRTKNVEARLEQLESMSPHDFETIIVLETDDMYDLEEYLHGRFEDKRVKGEWFDLAEEDIECLKGLE